MIELYTVHGSKLNEIILSGETIHIQLEKNLIYIIKTSAGTFKVML